jgi:3-oxoacyl-(acyl-carrier-protein) synthase
MQITRYCTVKYPAIKLDGSIVYEHPSDPAEFLKSAYRNLNSAYPKFFKMDNLSKLGFVAVEYLLKEIHLSEKYLPEEIGIVLQNSSSSLETDEKHQESISDRQNYFPSPSVFVYTLPNIMVGEIAIRQKIKGENAVLISEQPDPQQIFRYVNELIERNRVKCCITGWVEACHDRQEAMVMLVQNADPTKSSDGFTENINFAPSNIERIFKEA